MEQITTKLKKRRNIGPKGREQERKVEKEKRKQGRQLTEEVVRRTQGLERRHGRYH